MILVNSGEVQLEMVDFCMDFLVFFVILSVVEEVSSNSPVFHLPSTLDHLEKLGMRAHKHPLEPSGHWSSWHVI
jgi:hypothetical protein